MALLQNFSLVRNSDDEIMVTIEPDLTVDTLVNATIEWSVYGSSFGVPLPSPVLIHKTTVSGILILDSPPLTFLIAVAAVDTRALDLGNYYHEAIVIDVGGNRSPAIMYGIMALTLSLN